MTGPQVVLVYQHFYPDFSAGGPVTSIGNLAKVVANKLPVRILASNKVYSTGKDMVGIVSDAWTQWQKIPVWYASDRASLRRAIQSLPEGSLFYLNGLFLPDYFLYPLRLAHKLGHRVVISPRGMLQRGALHQASPLQKKFFITLLNAMWLKGNEVWHATDEEERSDIERWIRRYRSIVVIPNLPRLPASHPVHLAKERGQLKLIYYSLIARKKNLSFILELLKRESLPGISLDIAGPVKDADYWGECQTSIASLPAGISVRYIGEQDPTTVNSLLSGYHLFVLPTLGENFGHAIVEALSSFRPVLISDQTPWKDIGNSGAGESLPLDPHAWSRALKHALQWDQADFDRRTSAAMKYFTVKFQPDILRAKYLNLFAPVQQ
jgi:glycosyltransferase involved in cell wall biosynthesis